MMKKWLSVIIILLLLIVLVAPGGMGLIAQKRIDKLAAQLPINSPVNIKVNSYKRGWFSSDMQLDVTFVKLQHTPAIHVLLNEKVTHGPIIIDLRNKYLALGQAYAVGDLVVPEDLLALFKQYVDQTSLIKSTMLLHFFGGVTLHLNLPKLTVTDPADKNMKMVIEGAQTSAETNANLQHVETSFQLKSLTAQNEQHQLVLNTLEGKSNLHKSPQALWLGKINSQIDSVQVNAAEKSVLEVKNVQYNSESNESNGLMDAASQTTFKTLVVNGTSYGSGEIGLSIKNANAEPLAKLQKLLQEMPQDKPASSNNIVSTLKRQQKTIQARQLVFKVIGRGLELAVDPVSLKTPNGEVTAKFTVNLPNIMQDKNGHMGKHALITVGSLVSKAEAAFNISVPKTIVQDNLQKSLLNDVQAENAAQGIPGVTAEQQSEIAQRVNMQIQGWIASGFIIEKASNYEFSSMYKEGQLLVNGKPIFSPLTSGVGAGKNIVNPIPVSVTPSVAPAVVAPAPVLNDTTAGTPAATVIVAPEPVPTQAQPMPANLAPTATN